MKWWLVKAVNEPEEAVDEAADEAAEGGSDGAVKG